MGDTIVEKFRRLYPSLSQVKAQFLSYDEDSDGQLTSRELEIGMTMNKDFTREQAKAAFELADSNGDGVIDISEFVQLMFPTAKENIINIRKNFKGPQDVENKFKRWDTDGDGVLSIDELKEAALKEKFFTDEEIDAIFTVGDLDMDGKIDVKEFSLLMIPSVSDVVAKFRTAHRSVKDVRNAFKKYDRNGDGSIDKGELYSALTHYRLNFSDQEVDVIYKEADRDGDGLVDFEEFMSLMCPDASNIIRKFRSTYKRINDVKAAFKKYDKNRDGSLSKDEMSRMMYSTGYSFTDVEVDAIMNLGDANGDGEIDLDEFVNLMSPAATDVINRIRQNFSSIEEVKNLFKSIDVDSDGLLTKEEMMDSPNQKSFDEEEINAIYELGDSNGDNVLDMGEFIAIMFPAAGEAILKLSRNLPSIDQVKELFRSLDIDNDGAVTRAEMLEHSQRFSQEEVNAVFTLGDINDDGVIELEEFIGVLYPAAATVVNRLRLKFVNINDVKKAFATIDINGDGLISKEEMAQSDVFNTQEIDALFVLGDSNKDGEIDLEEFIGVLYPVVAQALNKFTKDVANVEDARFLFSQLDKDKDGLISQEELRRCGTRFSNKEIEALFAVGDINNDGEIDINEFINVMCPGATTVIARLSAGFNSEEDIKECFNAMDLNCDGKISRCEMAQYGKLNDQEVSAVFELGDADKDGEIDLQEFISVMTTSSPVPYKEGGEIVQLGDLDIYKVGSGPKCIIWCHDLAGFSGKDRTRQLIDKMAAEGFLIILPNFFLQEESVRDVDGIKAVSNWAVIRDLWVERILPWLRDDLGVRSIGVLGTGWGAYVATRLASYGEVQAGVLAEPSLSRVVELMAEDLYEVLEEVGCPQLVITARDDCPNEKEDGLAQRVWKSSSFSRDCEFVELRDVVHGYYTNGDRSEETIAVQAKRTSLMAIKFFKKLLHYDGEPQEVEAETAAKQIADFDLACHSSNACRTCLAIAHQANKATSRTY